MKAAVVRFPAALESRQPLPSSALLETLRRWAASRQPQATCTPASASPPRTDELPLDLDERVRLLGEW